MQKWCNVVSPVASEHLPANTLPRRLTIYLSAPPGDGMRSVREHFYEYVKPVLVAGAMDWEVVEGRREGDVRFATAERIRRARRRIEGGEIPLDNDEEGKAHAMSEQRQRTGTKEYDGPKGDLVIGRHTWKEYVRGVHEGWLGPLGKPTDVPVDDNDLTPPAQQSDGHAHSSLGDAAVHTATDLIDSATTPAADSTEMSTPTQSDGSPKAEEPTDPDIPKPKPSKPLPYISATDYATNTIATSAPANLDPVTILPFPHILGFLNTPVRTLRFLNRRHLADDIGRQTAACVLAAQSRPFIAESRSDMSNDDLQTSQGEQATLLHHEEADWPKSIHKARVAEPDKESVWLDPMTLDSRVAERMQTWTLPADREPTKKQ